MNEDVKLKDGERLDDLEIDGLKIIQNRDLYCFTSDAVLLANTVSAGSKDSVLDIGTGSGIIPIIIAAKKRVKHIDAVEIQSCMADMAARSVIYNGLDSVISVINADITEFSKKSGQYDVVVSNPPYFDAGERREREEIAIARHEVKLNLEELIESARRMLKFGGRFYMIHKCTRLAEVIAVMTAKGIIPKELMLIYPKASKDADTFIITGKSGAQHGLKVKKFVVYEENGEMTEEAKIMYNKEK